MRQSSCVICGGDVSHRKSTDAMTCSTACLSAQASAHARAQHDDGRFGKHNRRRWTEEVIIAAMQTDARRRGRAPTAEEWRGTRKTRPDTRTVTKRFGSWNAALVAAGFPPRAQHVGPRFKKRKRS